MTELLVVVAVLSFAAGTLFGQRVLSGVKKDLSAMHATLRSLDVKATGELQAAQKAVGLATGVGVKGAVAVARDIKQVGQNISGAL
jgi:hypothetical protein